ncbi:MAG: LamG domain-containing protein [Planctomycetota bacterium]
MKNKKENIHKRFYGPKMLLGGIGIGVVIAITGSVLALNGFFGGGNSIPEDTMTRGLVGYWGFEEGSGTVAHDASDYGNNGVASSTWATGKVGGAAQFDGVDDYVNVPHSNSLEPVNSVTFEAWVKRNGDNGSWQGILSKSDFSPNGGYHFGIQNNQNVLMYLYVGGTWVGQEVGPVPDNEWAHIVGTYDGAMIKIYINGTLMGSWAQTGNFNYTTDNVNLTIGKRTDAVGKYNGSVDEVRIYNRALSAEEVRYHYNRGGPVAHWKFDEGEGRTVYDSTDNNNDGTLVLAGSATSSAWVQGKYGSALSFDGVDDYVQLSDDITPTGNVTIEAWIKGNSWNTETNGSRIYDDYYFLFGVLSTGKVNFGRYQSGVDWDKIQGVQGLNTGQWYHIVGVYDGSQARIYVNGISDNSKSQSFTLAGDSANERIGGQYSGVANTWFDGLLDDVRIYNYARTPEEIRLDYNAGFAAKFGYTAAGCQRDPASCMTEGQVGYWGFEEGSGRTAHDASNYGNNGVASSTWATGKVGGAAQFDGVDDYVNVPRSSSIEPTTAISVEFWYKPNTISSNQRPLDKGVYGTNLGYQSARYSSNNTLNFSIGNGSVTQYAGANTVLTNGTWYHVVGVFDGRYVRLYINGVQESTVADFGSVVTMSNTTADLLIGGGEAYDNCSLDEVRIYNRALSSEEVRYHYNKGGPVAQWKMDEGNGRTAYDSTNNNNDGTLVLAGSATSSAWVSGKYGTALSFDGVDDYVDAGNKATLDRPTNWTIEAWVKPTGDFSIRRNIFQKFHNDGGWLLDIYTNGRLMFDWAFGQTATVCNTVLSLNVFTHIVVTYNGTNFQCFLNSDLDKTTNQSGLGAVSNGSSAFIGQFSNGRWFNGLIDDVRIYNYARTPEQIRQDYNAGFAAKLGPSGKDCNTDPASCMTKGLVGYWGFEEGSGTTIHGGSDYANNGVASSTWAKGKVGGALKFDGVDDRASISDSDSLDISDSVTMETWVKLNSVSVRQDLIYKTTVWGIFSNAPNFTAVVWSGGSNEWYASGFAPAINTWYHLVFTYQNNGPWAWYVNGSQTSSGTITNLPITTSVNQLYIGIDADGTSYPTNGLLDEVRIYNRVLSVEEVRYHYNKGGPVAQWKMDEGEGRVVYDSTDNNNDGTLVLAGSATSSAWVQGKYGSALSFDGVNDVVIVPDSASIESADSITLSTWVKANNFSDPNSLGPEIINHAESLKGYSLDISNAGKPRFWLGFPAGNTTLSAQATLTANKWYLITGVYDGSTMKIYIDGVLDNSVSQTGSIGNTTQSLTFGASNDSPYYEQFNGLIDDVRIYNYARTQSQIQQDYNAGLSTHFK